MKRFFKTLILSFLFITGLLYILLQSSPVQNYLLQKIVSVLENKLGTKVSIGHIDIDFFHGVKLSEVFICDLHEDTVIYSKALKIDINEINFSQNKFHVSYILLQDATIKLQRHKEDERWSYLILLDNFKTKKKDTTAKQNGWDVEIDELKLENCAFQYKDEHKPHITSAFDDSHIWLRQVSAQVNHLRIVGDSSKMEIKSLTAIEQSGFKIDNLKSKLNTGSKEINFSELTIATPYSHIENQFIMRFDSLADFDDFLGKIKLEVHFDKSTVDFNDLSFFSTDLKGNQQKLLLSGIVKGTIDNLKGKNMSIFFGKESYFKGDISFKGLPDVYETFFDISTKDALMNKNDLEYLTRSQLPDEFLRLGEIKFKVKAVGFLRDFVLEGSYNTAAGNIRTDINFKFPQDKIESYSGTAFFNDFNLGKFTGNKELEEVNGDISVKGIGLSAKTVNTKIDANLKSIKWNQYTYKNITAHGTIANKLFNGKALVDDENLKLDFDGIVDYSKSESIFAFNAKIRNANLRALNLDSSNSVLNADLHLELKGNNITNIYGTAMIPFISYLRGGRLYEFKNLNLLSEIRTNRRLIKITSDVLDAEIDGKYDFNDLAHAVENEINLLYPDYFMHYENISTQDFLFNFNLKKPKEFISLLNAKLDLDATSFNGYFNNINHSYAINLKSEQITYDNYSIDSVSLNSERKPQEPYSLYCSTKKIQQKGKPIPLVSSDTIIIVCEENNIKASIHADEWTTGNTLDVKSKFNFTRDDIAIQLNNSGGTFSSVDFSFLQQEPIYLNKDGARFTDFRIESKKQEVVVNGVLSSKPTDQLRFAIHNFQLKTLNSLAGNIGVKFFGEVNGNLSLSTPFTHPFYATDSGGINVKYFQIDKDTFGNMDVNSVYNQDDNIITSSVKFSDGELKNFTIEGKIYPNKKTNYLDFNIVMDAVPAKALNFVLKDVASDIEGTITGKAKLTGSFDNPEINGKAFLKNGGFTVDYLKTHYRFDNDIIIKKNAFEFQNMKIYDENRNTAIANGRIYHTNFQDFGIDISIRNFNNFKILNTSARDNDLFYGIGYATGNATISGRLENIKMVLNLKSNRGTIINIPLTNPEYSSKSTYITFKDRAQKVYKKYQVSTGGLELELNLEVNEDTYIKLIFDSQMGDIIEGTGNGNLNLNITPTGDFTMFGYYEIEHGKYVFTKYDVFNKPFIIKSGSRITWDGDPYGAKVDLEGVYSISQANASSLLSYTTTPGNQLVYIPVDCILYLKGLLFKPEITFNIEIPKLQNFSNPQLENTVKTYISGWQSNPDELNRQVFSLLFFKRFFPLDNAATVPGYVGSGTFTAVGDLITSQLNNWLGQVFTNNPLEIDYNKSDPNRTGIWVFKLSKTLFKDRLVLEGNYIYDGEQASNYTGNISAQVLLDKTGQLRFTVFSKKTNNTFTKDMNVFTNGVGLYWRTEFNTLRRKKSVPVIDETTSAPN
jgi:hypothetical protein